MDPQINTTAPAGVPFGSKKRNGRSRVSNDPSKLQPVSLFAQARRRRDLVQTFTAALGGPDAVSAVTAMQIKKAAELVSMCELARAGVLSGQPVDMLALIRLEGCATRAVRVLGIEKKPRGGAGGLEIARARWAEDSARKAAEKAGEAPTANATEGPPDDRAA
jgi:hypothetical protein